MFEGHAEGISQDSGIMSRDVADKIHVKGPTCQLRSPVHANRKRASFALASMP